LPPAAALTPPCDNIVNNTITCTRRGRQTAGQQALTLQLLLLLRLLLLLLLWLQLLLLLLGQAAA
jgi:hypothetical protein